MPVPITRRKFLKLTAAVAVAGAFADGVILEPNRPHLLRVEIPLARLPAALDGFTIAQLSDIHFDDYFSVVPLRRAIEIVNGLQPDLVALTGDYVTVSLFVDYLHNGKEAARDAEPCAQLLAGLHAPFGVIAILGNHDMASDCPRIIDAIQSQGIPILRNRSLPIENKGARFWLAGVEDALEGKPDLNLALKGIPAGEPVVLLAHEPDFADLTTKYPVDLQLSGHSHGGQIRLPVTGALYLPEMARKYPMGLRRVGPLTLYTNTGLGSIRVPVRFNCPPEITLFTLRSMTGLQ